MAFYDAIANAIGARGNALAQGALQSGQVWGNLAANLGQIPGQTIAYHQQRQDALQNHELKKLALEDAQREAEMEKELIRIRNSGLPPDQMYAEVKRVASQSPKHFLEFQKVESEILARKQQLEHQQKMEESQTLRDQIAFQGAQAGGQGVSVPMPTPTGPDLSGGNALSPIIMAQPNIPMQRVNPSLTTKFGTLPGKPTAAEQLLEKKDLATFKAGLAPTVSSTEHVEPDPTSSTGYRYMQFSKERNKYDIPSGEAPPRGAQTDEEMVALRKALMRKNLEKAPAGEGAGRLDKSYQYNATQLNNLSKPVRDRFERLDRLKISLDANSPQADALIAPELLTAAAGGQGSGLRMSEAEIARLVHGRSNWEELKARLNAWQTDPSQALSITPAQRAQIRVLVDAMYDKVKKKIQVLDQAQQDLINADDVVTHRQTVASTNKSLTDIDIGGAVPASGGAPIGAGGWTAEDEAKYQALEKQAAEKKKKLGAKK